MKETKSLREIMYENIAADHNEDARQGDILKELEASKDRQTKFREDAFTYGANYYTTSKLEKMKEDSNKYLHRDLNITEIERKVKDFSNFDISELEYLYKLEDKILKVKQKVDNACEEYQSEENIFESLITNFVDNINGGISDEN